jgi:hypothetical protein
MPGAIPLEAVDDGDDVDSFIETPVIWFSKRRADKYIIGV